MKVWCVESRPKHGTKWVIWCVCVKRKDATEQLQLQNYPSRCFRLRAYVPEPGGQPK